jgi:hypothetical protein
MSTKLDAMLSEVSSLVASATAVSAKKKPQHAVEKDSKGKFRIRSMKDGKLWPQTYDTKEKANKGLAAYHLRKKGVPPKKTKASALPTAQEIFDRYLSDNATDKKGKRYVFEEVDGERQPEHFKLLETVAGAYGLSLEEDEELAAELDAIVQKAGDLWLASVTSGDVSGSAKKPVNALASDACPECGADYEGETCDHCGCGTSASVVSAKLPKLHDDEQHALVQLVGDPADWRGYVRDTKWVLNNADQAFFDKYTRNGYKFFILIDKTAERRSPRSRIAFLVHPDGRVSAFDTNDRAITDGSVDEFIDMVRSKNATMASAKKVKAAEPSMSYDPRDKMYLRKLKKIVDRGYMEAEEVGGAVFEALHKAKVSNRMAGAIAQKVQEALFDAEEDVIDVSAKAKLAAKAKLEAARRK